MASLRFLPSFIKSPLRAAKRESQIALAQLAASVQRADIAVFHQFEPPPGGGGHQFLRALMGEFRRRGLRVENNRISPATKACLFNSFNFDFEHLRRLKRQGLRMVHRVDGPITVYRGHDDGSDRLIRSYNDRLADATVFQSRYSLAKHEDLGLRFRNPVVILNAADPSIFHRHGKPGFSLHRKARLVSTGWSSNVNKGAPVYEWLDRNLTWDRYEYTFIGRFEGSFRNIKLLPPVDSITLGNLLRRHDLFITASRNDCCSNSLIEATACGLPAVFLKSGGNPEIVGAGGLGFHEAEEIPSLLDQLLGDYDRYQEQIRLPKLSEAAASYLEIMGFDVSQ